MKLLKTVVAAVNVDDTCRRVLEAASILAKHFGSEVVLVHAIEPADRPSGARETPDAAIRSWLERLRAELAAGGVSAPPALCPRGKGFVEVVAAAEALDANLIVLGARATAAADSFTLGTTTEKVIRRSGKPVLAVHPERPVTLENILCPVDFSDTSARGLTNAIRLARAFHGKLHVLTVMPPPSGYHQLDLQWSQWAVAAEGAAAAQWTREFQEFLSRFDFRDVPWEKRIARGEPAHEIITAARASEADLIVMGSVGRTGLPYVFMGSTALKVARQLPCALLTVKQAEVLIARLEQDISDINTAYQEGQELLAQGFCGEAMQRFERCLGIDPYFAHAIEGKRAVHERMGHPEQAEQCRKQAEMIRETLWEQRVTASIRASHPLFSHRRSFE